jgi:ribokinase
VRLAVVGHVEWVQFLRVDHAPVAGEIEHAHGFLEQAAGGGAVAAVQLVKLAGACDFFTALGDDDLGRRAREQLSDQGVRVHAATVAEPQRRAVVFIDGVGERTITVIGHRLVPSRADRLPWEQLARADGVYFTGGDVGALEVAREGRVLVATPRTMATLIEAKVALDALVGSATDPGERYEPGELDPPPRLRVATMGAKGGIAEPGGAFAAAPLPGPIADAYGAGDSFAAGLTYGLASGWRTSEAIALAARCGAAAVTGSGAFEGQLATA